MKKLSFIYLVLFILLSGILVYRGMLSKTTAKTNYAVLEAATGKQLSEVIENVLPENREDYGIIINNLKTDEIYSLNANVVFDTASLYKLWVMATVYDQINKRQLNENQILNQNIEILNKKFNIASESAEINEGEILLSVHDALEKMITVSDNYAALLLAEKVKLSSVSTFLKNNGFNQSDIGANGNEPFSTPNNIAIFFKKLYDSQLVSAGYSQEMLSLLKRQKLNSKIPKLLPRNITIAHKTGELDQYNHDAGIVYTDNGDYIIVLMSKSNDPPSAVKKLSEISKVVYDYSLNK